MTIYPNYVITPRQRRLWSYKKALKEELQHTYSEESLSRCPINHPRILEYKGRILGGRSQVNDFADWTEFLLEKYGPKQISLSLGSGVGRVERYLIQIGFTPRFETIELNPRHNAMARDTDVRIYAHEGDLNFVKFKPNTYDFILCHGILHHLINLEYVLEQINHALKPEGLLLVYEYVGEDRMQFNEARLSRLHEMFPDVKLKDFPIWKVPGFESVRSGSLLRLLEAQFGEACERSVNYGGVYFPLVVCNWRAVQQQIEHVVELDAEVSQRGEMLPCYHMGVYRKSKAVLPRATPWSDEQLKEKLFPPMLVHQRLVRFGISIRSRIRLRTRLRSFVSHVSPLASQPSLGGTGQKEL